MTKPSESKDADKCLEIYPLHRIPEAIKRLIHRLRHDKKQVEGRAKESKIMMLIGGGEIGAEISIAALSRKKRKQWLIRTVVDSEEFEPIRNIPQWYGIGDLRPRVKDCLGSIDVPDFKSQFVYIRLRRPYEVDSLAKGIMTHKPDVVILEDFSQRG